jgi:hypothetical protein
MKAEFVDVKSMFDSKSLVLQMGDLKVKAINKELCYEILKDAIETRFASIGRTVEATITPCEGGAEVNITSDEPITFLNYGVLR